MLMFLSVYPPLPYICIDPIYHFKTCKLFKNLRWLTGIKILLCNWYKPGV